MFAAISIVSAVAQRQELVDLSLVHHDPLGDSIVKSTESMSDQSATSDGVIPKRPVIT